MVAELHHSADADVADLGYVPRAEEAGEPAQVGHVELGRAGTRTRVVGEVDFEVFDQAVYFHAHHSNGKSGQLGILPVGDRYLESFGLARLASAPARPHGRSRPSRE